MEVCSAQVRAAKVSCRATSAAVPRLVPGRLFSDRLFTAG